MPNVPSHGAAGGVSFTGGKPPVGPHEEMNVEPDHGADGAYDVPFMWGAKFRAPDEAGKTAMKNPALGG